MSGLTVIFTDCGKQMSLKVGIVGLPNVGKSTVFKALTKKQVDAQNYPFCTIEPNVGIVEVKDERVDRLATVALSEKKIYATVEFVDIAGLVKGAHSGKGLGNKFLSHIREVDVIVQVLRDFIDEDVFHTEGSVDAVRDKDIINVELIYADIELVEKIINRLEKETRGKNKDAIKKMDLLKRIKENLEKENMISSMIFNKEEQDLLKEHNFLTDKPFLFVRNVNTDYKNNKEGDLLINAKLEAEIAEVPEEDLLEYMKEMGIEESGLNRLIRESYRKLDLISFFTAGEKEARAWSVKKGSLAPEAAGKIHTDFEKNFIRAEIITFTDFITYSGWSGGKREGVVKDKGKDYEIEDGDVVFFKIGQIN